MVTFVRIREDGSWGVRGPGLTPGQRVTATRRDGSTTIVTVGQVVWRAGDGRPDVIARVVEPSGSGLWGPRRRDGGRRRRAAAAPAASAPTCVDCGTPLAASPPLNVNGDPSCVRCARDREAAQETAPAAPALAEAPPPLPAIRPRRRPRILPPPGSDGGSAR